jgi:NADH dehydrogenase
LIYAATHHKLSDVWTGHFLTTTVEDGLSAQLVLSHHLRSEDFGMAQRIVIVGGGAGGIELAARLGRKLGRRGKAEIILVDAQLTHTWKPLLHEMASGTLNSADHEVDYLAQAKSNHFEFQVGRLAGIERKAKQIHIAATFDRDGAELVPARTLAYDKLVIAIGSLTNDFGIAGVAEFCVSLDAPREAATFHRRLLGAYLRAHASEREDTMIDVAIVGGGATGVELAAELRNTATELSAYGLKGVRPDNLRITLVEAGPRLLPALPDAISAFARAELTKLGVNVLTTTQVSEVTADGLRTATGNLIPATLKVWAAGIRAPAILRELDGLETNRLNQLVVRSTLQTTHDDDIFALGDCAACPIAEGATVLVPPRAQAAHQQASFLATMLPRRLEGQAVGTYRYRDHGSLVSLSRSNTIGNLIGGTGASVTVKGWLARFFYLSLYRMHQQALYGYVRTGLLMLMDRLGRRTVPRLKLH